MPNELPTTIRPFGGFRFHSNRSFSEALPFIRKAESGIISADRAGYTFKENAERTDALRVRLSDPFRRGVQTFVFDCRLVESRGLQPRHRLDRYLFVAEQPAIEGESSESAFLERLIKLCGAFNKGSLIFIPYAASDKTRRAMSVFGRPKKAGGLTLEQLGSVNFDAEAERATITGPDKRLVFDVTGTAPVVQPSMITAYLFRTWKRRQYAGMPISDEKPQTPTVRIRQAPRKRFSWSGECAVKEMRYASGRSVKATINGGHS